ncbi:hypothetical protein ACLBWT_01720 [Paenibacillus sp. D51F]
MLISITDVDGFKQYKATEGYFIITDTTGTKVHTNRCVHVDVSHFREKVIENNAANGNYLFTDDLLE